MKVEKLVSKNQPQNWFDQITKECLDEYPIDLVDWISTTHIEMSGYFKLKSL